MRITQSNVESLKEYVEQITDVADDLVSACEEWIEGLEDPERDPEDQQESRALIEEHFDTVLESARSIVTLPDKWALYETGQSKRMKAKIAKLEESQIKTTDGLFAIVSAYYHASETTYAFGPFNKDELDNFINGDPDKSKHEPWDIVYVNLPSTYNTGNERSTY